MNLQARAFVVHVARITRHQSPLSMGDRSGVTVDRDTLGSEARSVTSQYADDEQSSGGGLPSIPEGEGGGPPSPNATESEGSATEVAQKAAAI